MTRFIRLYARKYEKNMSAYLPLRHHFFQRFFSFFRNDYHNEIMRLKEIREEFDYKVNEELSPKSHKVFEHVVLPSCLTGAVISMTLICS